MTPTEPPHGLEYRIFGAPKNWSNEEHGPCVDLRVVESEGVFYSYWRASWRERLEILFGRSVRVSVVGLQPPIAISTQE